jgi:predicted anti-sigma-YlaC factor YlaD
MTCDETRYLVTRYDCEGRDDLDSFLLATVAERTAVIRHLRNCPSCDEWFTNWKEWQEEIDKRQKLTTEDRVKYSKLVEERMYLDSLDPEAV